MHLFDETAVNVPIIAPPKGWEVTLLFDKDPVEIH